MRLKVQKSIRCPDVLVFCTIYIVKRKSNTRKTGWLLLDSRLYFGETGIVRRCLFRGLRWPRLRICFRA